jgi:glycosyltransferase involved in cell wall biosynthesis
VKVVFLTTSYPRDEDEVAGHFVQDAADSLREAGVDVAVVSPASFRHFGIAYGHGIPGNLRRRPWLALLLPAFVLGFARAARRAARDADLVHAHWLPSAVPALATGKPLVLQLWGSDAELARRARRLFRPLVRRARVVVCPSTALAAAARELGAGDVRVVPPVVALPEDVAEPADPPHVLYAGRLSPEKGIVEFLSASGGLPRVIVGDGPLRPHVREALGFIPPADMHEYFERASIVCVPSRREGFGFACAEAMAHGRPVVASAVGGLLDLVEDGETGLLVPAGDVPALRAALERLLGDPGLRGRLGAAAGQRARERLSTDAFVRDLLGAYRDALAPRA